MAVSTPYPLPPSLPVPLNVQKPLWEKQEEAVQFCKDRGTKGWGLFCDRGTGKTRITIELIKYYLDKKDAKLGFVVAPISVLRVWPHEWALWGDRHVMFVDLSDAKEEGLIKALAMSQQGWPVICLVNYDSAWRIGYKYETIQKKVRLQDEELHHAKENGLKQFKFVDTKDYVKRGTSMEDIYWDFGILDESQKIKTHTSRSSKFFHEKMVDKITYRGCLTGSGYTKSPLNVWAQLKYIAKDEFIKQSYTSFKLEYAIPHPRVHGAILGYRNLDKLIRMLSKSCMLLKKEEVVDIPPATHEIRYIELSPKNRAIYNKVKKDCYAELEELEGKLKEESNRGKAKVIMSKHVFSSLIRLGQIASGFVVPQYDIETDEDGEIIEIEQEVQEPIFLGSAKYDVLIDIIEEKETEHPTLIVVQRDYEEKLVSEAIEKHFKFKPKILNGDVKGAKKRHSMVEEAINDRVFIVKEEVACRGMDMRAFDLTIYISHRPMTEAYEQMNDRTHRGGQDKPVSYIHLIAHKTVDERIFEILTDDLDRTARIDEEWRKLLIDGYEDDEE